MLSHLLDAGFAKPRVESQCPTDVFKSVQVTDDFMQKMAEEEGLEVLQPELGAKPRVYYKNMHFFTKCFVGGSVVATVDGVEDCVEGAEVVVRKDDEEVGRATTDTFGEFKVDGLEPNSGAYEVEVSGVGGNATKGFEVGDVSLYLGEVRLG